MRSAVSRLSVALLLLPSLLLSPLFASSRGAAAPVPQGQEELKQKRQQKLDKPVFKRAAWIADYDAARAQAKQAGTLLLVLFTRSYAPCEPCEQIESGLLASDEFVKWSKKVTLCLHVTSRVTGEPHGNLLYEMGGNGFPTLSLLDADGNLLQQVGGGEVGLDALERAWQKLQAWKALRTEVEAGKAERARELFWMEIAMGNRPYSEMVQRAGAMKLEGADQAKVAQQLTNLQFTEVLRRTPREDKAAAGAQLLPLFEAGRYPDCATETSYWDSLFAHAVARKDAALYGRILEMVKQRKAGDARLKRYLRQLEDQYEELKQKRG